MTIVHGQKGEAMNNREAVNWLINISADIGKTEHSDLWHYEQALTEIKDMLESAQPSEWIKVPRCEGDTQPNLKCPICGNVIGWWDLGRYCAGCGTKLEGGAG